MGVPDCDERGAGSQLSGVGRPQGGPGAECPSRPDRGHPRRHAGHRQRTQTPHIHHHRIPKPRHPLGGARRRQRDHPVAGRLRQGRRHRGRRHPRRPLFCRPRWRLERERQRSVRRTRRRNRPVRGGGGGPHRRLQPHGSVHPDSEDHRLRGFRAALPRAAAGRKVGRPDLWRRQQGCRLRGDGRNSRRASI